MAHTGSRRLGGWGAVMIRIARNPDGTPDDIVITDPISVHIEDMGGGWWLRVDTASGEAIVADLWPVVTLPKRLPPWAKVKAEQLLKWIKGRVRISALAEVETSKEAPSVDSRRIRVREATDWEGAPCWCWTVEQPGWTPLAAGNKYTEEDAWDAVRLFLHQRPVTGEGSSDRAQIAALGAQPAPLPATGDVWQEVIDAEPLAELRELYTARRALGVERYDTPLQRGNGRDNLRDALEEALDLLVYLHAEHLYREAETVRVLVIRLHGLMVRR